MVPGFICKGRLRNLSSITTSAKICLQFIMATRVDSKEFFQIKCRLHQLLPGYLNQLIFMHQGSLAQNVKLFPSTDA